MNVYLSAREAANFLQVSKQTLYAYVSRGFLRSDFGKDSRSRLYNRLDLERLKERKRIRKHPGAELSEALSWGPPLLDSKLSLITNGRLYYRGVATSTLALQRSFWDVASWFWTGSWGAQKPLTGDRRHGLVRADPILSFHERLLEMAATDPLGYDFTPPALVSTGGAILQLFLGCLTRRSNASIARTERNLQRGWCPRLAKAEGVINAALVLCIDHELNPSSFTARVVCSAGANLYEVVSAALCALRGARHGGATERSTSLLTELRECSSVRKAILKRLRSGVEIPGFGHPLYPGGDPRAGLLLRLLAEYFPSEAQPWLRAIAVAEKVIQRPPNIDLALAACARILSLPTGAAFGLFALGRTVGWIGHAAEQHLSGQTIRPRARYVGPLPQE
ncbi:MAG: citrate synthase family protein [Chthoniobacterales bacterium]